MCVCICVCVCMYMCMYIYIHIHTYNNIHTYIHTTYMLPWLLYGIHIHIRILLGHKKNETLPLATTWMDLEGILLNEISQIYKDKYCLISFICGIYKNQTHRNKDQICCCQGHGRGIRWKLSLGKKIVIISSFSYKINKFWGYNVQHYDYS